MVKSRNTCFQLKADFLPITTLKLTHYDLAVFQAQLESTVLKAPHYFTNAPMIIDFSLIQDHDFSDEALLQMMKLMREYQMIPVAVRALPNQKILPNIPDASTKPAETAETRAQRNNAHAQKPGHKLETKLITKPVRAGTQIYARDADLVIVAPVNAGAEVIADGNIHVYGSLRGRALAGANGDTKARIFCHDLDPELISIAGHYLVSDQLQDYLRQKGMAHVFLDQDNETIKIEMI